MSSSSPRRSDAALLAAGQQHTTPHSQQHQQPQQQHQQRPLHSDAPSAACPLARGQRLSPPGRSYREPLPGQQFTLHPEEEKEKMKKQQEEEAKHQGKEDEGSLQRDASKRQQHQLRFAQSAISPLFSRPPEKEQPLWGKRQQQQRSEQHEFGRPETTGDAAVSRGKDACSSSRGSSSGAGSGRPKKTDRLLSPFAAVNNKGRGDTLSSRKDYSGSDSHVSGSTCRSNTSSYASASTGVSGRDGSGSTRSSNSSNVSSNEVGEEGQQRLAAGEGGGGSGRCVEKYLFTSTACPGSSVSSSSRLPDAENSSSDSWRLPTPDSSSSSRDNKNSSSTSKGNSTSISSSASARPSPGCVNTHTCRTAAAGLPVGSKNVGAASTRSGIQQEGSSARAEKQQGAAKENSAVAGSNNISSGQVWTPSTPEGCGHEMPRVEVRSAIHRDSGHAKSSSALDSNSFTKSSSHSDSRSLVTSSNKGSARLRLGIKTSKTGGTDRSVSSPELYITVLPACTTKQTVKGERPQQERSGAMEAAASQRPLQHLRLPGRETSPGLSPFSISKRSSDGTSKSCAEGDSSGRPIYSAAAESRFHYAEGKLRLVAGLTGRRKKEAASVSGFAGEVAPASKAGGGATAGGKGESGRTTRKGGGEGRGGTFAAEPLAGSIKVNSRPRSASHQPVITQSTCEQEEEEKTDERHEKVQGTNRHSVSSHWLWREFFWHALHYSHKSAATAKQRAARTATSTVHSVARHFGSSDRGEVALDVLVQAAATGKEGGEEAAKTGEKETSDTRVAIASSSAESGPAVQKSSAAGGGGGGVAAASSSSCRERCTERERTSDQPATSSAAEDEAAAGNIARGEERGSSAKRELYSVATLFQSAVHVVKSLPHRVRREWSHMLRARKNSAHINHTQRVQRAADVEEALPSAVLTSAAAGITEAKEAGKAASAVTVLATERAGRDKGKGRGKGGGGKEKGASTRSNRVTQQQPQLQRNAKGMPAVAGRFYPKSQKERMEDLQAVLHMRQVIPTRETRGRLLQQLQKHINKGRRDFERSAPLLSLRREQLLPCGSNFVVRCLQEDFSTATHIQRKYLTAGRLIGGGSEAMVFAAVETPSPPFLPVAPFHCPLSDLVAWGRAAAYNASKPVSGGHSAAFPPLPPTLTAGSKSDAAAGGADPLAGAGDRRPRSAGAHPASRCSRRADAGIAAAAFSSGLDAKIVQESGSGCQYTPSPARAGSPQPQEPLQRRMWPAGRKYDYPPLREKTEPLQRQQREQVGRGFHHRAVAAAAILGERGERTKEGRGENECCRSSRKDVGEAGSLSSRGTNVENHSWSMCWALKWFLCEPYLAGHRSKAEQEGTVVDWLQMAIWRLMPLSSINVEVMDQLGIVAPHWIGFIEGLPLVSPGDARFSMLNRVAAMPLMLGDLLTVSPVALSISDRLYSVMRIIQAVANMHAMGVLHNDIKLENILVGTDGALHIADLGTVMPFTGRPTRFQRIGTDVYLDPQSAQQFLRYEAVLWNQQRLQLQYHAQQKSKKDAEGETQRSSSDVASLHGAAFEGMPEIAVAETCRAAARKRDSAEMAGSALCKEGNVRDREGGKNGANDSSEGRGGDFAGLYADIKESGGGDAGSENIKRKRPGDMIRPFRTVYTPMRDAWAAGVVCYYIWCGGLLPYNLHRAFNGDISGSALFEFIARLPNSQKGRKLLFPLGNCPEGEAEELMEVRRLIEGMLEPDHALRRTPLEIVQESPLFSAYRTPC